MTPAACGPPRPTAACWWIRPPAASPAILADNRSRLAAWDYDFQGRSACRLREQVRREVMALAVSFLKRHGLDDRRLARDAAERADRSLDRDRASARAVPPGRLGQELRRRGDRRRASRRRAQPDRRQRHPQVGVDSRSRDRRGGVVRTTAVEFDRWGGEIPYEDLASPGRRRCSRRSPIGCARSWAMRSPTRCSTTSGRGCSRGAARPASLGLRFSLARREIEASWGVSNLELPLSAVCQTDGFLWFVSHLLAQLPRYLQIHNEAWPSIALAHGIRSRNHPVAALATQGEWLEAPFWVWRRDSPRRRGLLARLRGREMDLRIAGEDEVLLELPLAPDREACCAVERLRDLPAQSIRLRTRALTTTLFSRFLLGDLFIHGIGGAKYDELGDEIARRFFGIEPPALPDRLADALARPSRSTRPLADLAELDAGCATCTHQSRPPFARTVSRGAT